MDDETNRFNLRRTILMLLAVCVGFASSVSAATFLEQGGLVVMEVESTDSPLGEWIVKTDVSNYTGSGHFEFTGNGVNGGPATSPLEYPFRISQAGSYRMFIRARKRLAGEASDKCNDGYVKMAGNFTSGGSTPLNLLTNNTKFFGGNANNWGWAEQLDDANGVKWDAVYAFNAGETYTLTVSGRSIRWNIDRIVLRHSSIADADAKDISHPESPTDGANFTGELKKWHKLTLTIDGPQASEDGAPNPFMDYRMNVTFSNGGRDFLVPGYFAADGDAANTGATGGGKWRAHFAPDAIGQWTYVVSFREGGNVAVSDDPAAGSPVAGVDGVSGSFTVGPTDKTGRDLRGKGLLKYVGKHHLQFAETGEYFLKCGADAPENFLAYEDFDGPFKSDGHKDNLIKNWSPHVGDWQTGDPVWQGTKGKGIIGAVNYLASEGLNVFSFLTMNIDGDDRNVFPYTDYDERLRMDCSRLDQWELVFEHADRMGMYLHFKTQETENELLLNNGDLGNQRKLYYRELIARFGHHLALNWNLGEEIDNASTAQKKDWAEYFWTHDPYQHHIVIHNGANHYDLLGPGSALTGFSLQTNQSDFSNVHGQTKNYLDRSVAAGKPWVVACDEPGDAQHALRPDDDAGASHVDGRKNALWGNVLAGGAGLEFYFGYQHDHSDLTCNDFRSRDAFWDYCRYCLEFFNNYNVPFWSMTNDNGLSDSIDDYCLYLEDHTYVVYLKNGGSTNLNLSNATGDFIVKWYNPRGGGALHDGSVTLVSGGGNVALGNAPAAPNQDWAILVRRADGANLPPNVNSGPDQSLMLPQGGGPVLIQLAGVVTDDGLPSGTLTHQWSTVSGPGAVTFSDATALNPQATFSVAGDYVLELSASDGALANADIVAITVAPYGDETEHTFDPEDDAFLENNTRFNTQELKVEAGRRITYFKFIVAGLTGEVRSATLTLTENNDPGNGTLRFYRGSHNNWTEENITTANAPIKDGEIAQRAGAVSAGQTIEIDVTSLITGNGVFSLVVEMDAGGNDVWFGSKESAKKPVLTVIMQTFPRLETRIGERDFWNQYP